jgi:hypothetical protein
MAKKKQAEKKDMSATAEATRPATPKRKLANAVRLDLSDRDYARLERICDLRGLNKSSYARMAVVEMLLRDEERFGAIE